MKRILIVLLFLTTFTACSIMQPVEVHLSNTFDPNEAEFINSFGTGEISGNAFLRQQGGGVVTCAGSEVTLVPVNSYSTERVFHLYGNTTSGYINLDKKIVFIPEAPPAYLRYTRVTRCDSSGNFRFTSVPNGDFFVHTRIVWRVGDYWQGGYLMQRVSLDVVNRRHQLTMSQ